MLAELAAGETKHSESEERDRRRTGRARVPIPVFVYGYNPQATPFGEQGHMIEINAHGALISMKTAVSVGERLLLAFQSDQGTQECTVLAVTARRGLDAEVAVAFDTPTSQFQIVLLTAEGAISGLSGKPHPAPAQPRQQIPRVPEGSPALKDKTNR